MCEQYLDNNETIKKIITFNLSDIISGDDNAMRRQQYNELVKFHKSNQNKEHTNLSGICNVRHVFQDMEPQ